MESPVSATIFTTSINFTMKPNMTNFTQAICDVPAKNIFIFAYSLVFLVSVVLNSITMYVYFCTNQHVQSSITIYMKNLVAADFFLCLCLLIYIASYVNSSEILVNISCSLGIAAFYSNMYASIFFMELIAANRYLKIVRPLETHALQTVRTAHRISAAIWLFLLVLSFTYVTYFLYTSWGQKPDEFSCESQHDSQLSVIYKSIHCVTMLVFSFVLVSMIILYWKTLQKLRQVQFSTQTVKVIRSKRNMLVLVVIFCVCFLPYQLAKLPYVFIRPLLKDCTALQIFYILKEVTIVLAALNACLDPLIYFFFCKTYRSQFNFRSCQTCP